MPVQTLHCSGHASALTHPASYVTVAHSGPERSTCPPCDFNYVPIVRNMKTTLFALYLLSKRGLLLPVWGRGFHEMLAAIRKGLCPIQGSEMRRVPAYKTTLHTGKKGVFLCASQTQRRETTGSGAFPPTHLLLALGGWGVSRKVKGQRLNSLSALVAHQLTN